MRDGRADATSHEETFGRFGGEAGIAEFTALRWISLQTTPRHDPF